MRINGFLGELVEAPAIMNEFSYNFVLFGAEPSTTAPWGFSFYGHHLCLNAFFYKNQMVLSPWFTGAEPNLIDDARAIRVAECKRWFHETYFCWIGGFEDTDPFYYRIQSPVIMVEFDHHSGVFLNNQEPAKFHIHTLLRTPNAGDYRMALRKIIPGMTQEYLWEG
ncbi:hypothetical protein ACHAPJ_003846 [Fusarium lateritium]